MSTQSCSNAVADDQARVADRASFPTMRNVLVTGTRWSSALPRYLGALAHRRASGSLCILRVSAQDPGARRHIVKWAGMYLVGFIVLIGGVLAALWKLGILE